ncbi:hypothetical protein [Chryseobacterium lathyri]|uniref:Lipoprotein n=1 Tax=Chryseobacterium lathyri TaxID=395933 RepID=A0A511Y7K2_9FLAO|nr:hypothetical protein [Chryseobacterium lathyri]GEN71166.1 hypothetical protein CLA01_12380 [Chryseobacterium lathyri]
MKTKILTLHIIAGILLSIVIISCREESLPHVPYEDVPIITTERIVLKSDSTELGKEPEINETDPPKDRDNWKAGK